MDATVRERLLSRFSRYLDDIDAQPPGQAEPADAPDLFSLLAELAALKNEVKIESRQVKTALNEFRGLFDTLQQANTRLDDELGRRRERETRERHEAERALLLELLDLRDRMQAGHDHINAYHPGRLARWGGADHYVAGIADGQAMILRRLDETLAQHGVRPITAIDQPFDPATMHAAGTQHLPERQEGQVVAETRAGYLHHDQLLRAAEVIVNKND